jgi:hypothetical protein
MQLFNRKRINPPTNPSDTLGSTDTLPATPTSFGGRIAASGNAALNKASSIYKENPKVVGGLALLASALVLNRLKRPTH